MRPAQGEAIVPWSSRVPTTATLIGGAHYIEKRNRWPLLILLPTLLAAVYFGLIASDQYVSEVRFVVHSTAKPKLDPVGSILGLPSQSDSLENDYIIRDFLASSEAIDQINSRLSLENVYARPDTDYLSRLPTAPTKENLRKYWRDKIDLSIDKATGIITMSVAAFTPEDSLHLARAVLSISEAKINDMSLRMRRENLKAMEKEVDLTKARVDAENAKLSNFRQAHGMLDPAKSAELRSVVVGKIEEEMISKTAELASLKTYLQPEAPQVVLLEKRIEALKNLLQEESAKNASTDLPYAAADSTNPHGDLVNEFKQLSLEIDLSEKAYIASVTALESARQTLAQQSLYLVTFVEPSLPEEALLPRRGKIIASVLVFSLLLWGAGHLILATIREHRQWRF